MNPQHPRVMSCTLVRIHSRWSDFLHIVAVLLVIAGVSLIPAMTNVAQAAGAPDAPQSEMAAVGCYGVYHIVRPGQTLYSIAAAYGTTAYRIAVCNGISSYTVYVGQSLLVPTYRTR